MFAGIGDFWFRLGKEILIILNTYDTYYIKYLHYIQWYSRYTKILKHTFIEISFVQKEQR